MSGVQNVGTLFKSVLRNVINDVKRDYISLSRARATTIRKLG